MPKTHLDSNWTSEDGVRLVIAWLRDRVKEHCNGKERFCEHYGCETLTEVADKLERALAPLEADDAST